MQIQKCTIPHRVRRQWACSILSVLIIAICASASLNRWYYWNQHANDRVQTNCYSIIYGDNDETRVNTTSVDTIETYNCTNYWIYSDKLGNEHAVCVPYSTISNNVYNDTFKCYYKASDYNSVTLQWEGQYQLNTWTKVFYTCMTLLMLSFALVILLFIHWNLQHGRNLREQTLVNSAWDDPRLVEMQTTITTTMSGTVPIVNQEMYDSRHVNFVQTPYTSIDYTRSLVSRRSNVDDNGSEQDGESDKLEDIIDDDSTADAGDEKDDKPPLVSFLNNTNPDYAMDPDVQVV